MRYLINWIAFSSTPSDEDIVDNSRYQHTAKIGYYCRERSQRRLSNNDRAVSMSVVAGFGSAVADCTADDPTLINVFLMQVPHDPLRKTWYLPDGRSLEPDAVSRRPM